jgi:hypothetical protein
VYTGQWISGRRHGNGRIDYPDGSSYEGNWENDQMHGNGKYIDNDGIEWDGIFVNNNFESKIQKKLQTERKVMVSYSLINYHRSK